MTKKKTAKKKAKKVTVRPEEKMKARDHTAKAAEVKELKRALVEGRDAVILINIFVPGSAPQEFKMRIPKIANICPPPHKVPSFIAGIILGALKRKYGNKVK